jgi:hypothetical protein
MPKHTIDLTATACDVLGHSTADAVSSVELAARIMAAEVRDLESYFMPQEWRVLACALAESTFPPNREPGNRIIFELQDITHIRDVSTEFNVVLDELVAKVSQLTVPQQWSVVATVQLAVTHCPTQLDSEEWWTLDYRHAAHQPTDATSKRRSTRRQAKSPEKAQSRHTMTDGTQALADQPLSEGF